MLTGDLPDDLQALPGLENPDFCVKSPRAHFYVKSYFLIGFGFIWSVSVFYLLYSVFFSHNGRPTPTLTLGLILKIGMFIAIGIAVLIWGLYLLFEKGGWIIGTSQRLFIYKKGKLRSYFWDQFSGKMEFRGNPRKANIFLELKSGKMVRYDNNPRVRYVPDYVNIFQIENGIEIETIIRKRIDENHLLLNENS